MRNFAFAAAAVVLGFFAHERRALAVCAGGCPPFVGPCGTTTRSCVCESTQVFRPNASPETNASPEQLPGCIYICEEDTFTPSPAGSACHNDASPCDYCDGAGTCKMDPSGGSACGTMCIAAGTCCTNANCTSLNTSTQTGVCPSAGGTCVPQCNSGYKMCGSTCIASTACCTTADCGGNGHVCSGGACVCSAGDYDCQGVCIANMTCCTSPSTCSAGVGNGSSVCPSNGSQCMVQCNAGYKACGGGCIANAACCTNQDCTSLTNPALHDHGTCSSPGGSCVTACDAGYKSCNGSCIATSACCSAADCTTAPSGCYLSQGTCSAGTCSYPYNNGASCNADNNACTPNDTCKNGSCIADTAHQVMCVQKDCHTAPSCNPTSGNCVDSDVANGTTCGGNGCSSSTGTCTAGTCSSPPKDCSALNSACQVGTCNASGPVGTPCAAENVPNGTACAVDDKCVIAPACSGGTCVGQRVQCTPSGPCRTATCDPASGNCGETVAVAGTSCSVPGACIQNSSCDANGNCTGDPVPDGTPCEKSDCTIAAACGKGTCQCADNVDLGTGGTMSTNPNGGTIPPASGKGGCSTTPGSPASPVAPMVLAIAAFLCARRARRAGGSRPLSFSARRARR